MTAETMKAAVFMGPGRIEVQDVPKPVIEQPTDAIVRILRACVCGSDLWWYRGLSKQETGKTVGHEAIGIVESVGSGINDAAARDGAEPIHPGDFVVVPFTAGCGHCPACRAGFDANCMNPDATGKRGYQAQYLRYPHADWGLVKVPGKPEGYTDDQLDSLLTLSDVMATGYHAAASAEVAEGDTVVVMGDGAVGLCGVIASKLRGAKRIIAMSRHADRQALAKEFGATDIVPDRGDDAVKAVHKLLGVDEGKSAGADAVLECVGTELSFDTAVKVARPGAVVGRVGIPQSSQVDLDPLYWRNVGMCGGIANVTTYDRGLLLDAVLEGRINPGRVFTKRFDLEHAADAYAAMDKRESIKSLIMM